jgi:hypothetical protein
MHAFRESGSDSLQQNDDAIERRRRRRMDGDASSTGFGIMTTTTTMFSPPASDVPETLFPISFSESAPPPPLLCGCCQAGFVSPDEVKRDDASHLVRDFVPFLLFSLKAPHHHQHS